MLKKNSNDEPMSVNDLKIHPLANTVPMATFDEQSALKEDIKKNGQQIPVLLYRKQIIDGRCRALTCSELGITLKTETLPHKTPKEEVKRKVKSLNTRRNLSITQKSLVAAREHINNPKMKQEDICSSWGVGANSFFSAKYIVKNRPDYAEQLFRGYSVPIEDGKQSKSIQVVANYIKREIEKLKANAITLPDYEFDVNKVITTQAGKTWFKDAVNAVGGFNMKDYPANDVKGVLASIADAQTTPFP